MSRYRYVKELPRKKEVRADRASRLSSWQKRLSLAAIFLGLFLFANAVGPILFYEFFTAPLFRVPDLVTPAAGRDLVLGSAVAGQPDLTKIDNWFPQAPRLQPIAAKIMTYTLTVPKLRIRDAVVKIGGEDLSQSLIHYGGTALPGQAGNAVIIGHSVLPQFYNPTSYMTIFSLLPTLKAGDNFYINYDGIQYRYVIEDLSEVEPTNFSVLEQRFDDSYATLITCVPPGLSTRRLAVKARQVSNLLPVSVKPGSNGMIR
jgi:sortase A